MTAGRGRWKPQGAKRTATLAVAGAILLGDPAAGRAWGPAGHAIVARAALAASDDLPPWFREAGEELADLANAPDRWRAQAATTPAVKALEPDHFFDLDVWGREPLPPDRWSYVHRALRRGLEPEKVGLLPFAMLEQYGLLVSAFRDARAGRPGSRAAAIATAGTLAHLAGDAAVPLHVTRHHHGWVGSNPDGFTRAASVHRWFETDLVARIDAGSVVAGPDARQDPPDVATTVRDALAASLAEVPRLYRAERASRLERDDAAVRRLVRERLASGAALLAHLWRAAWAASGR